MENKITFEGKPESLIWKSEVTEITNQTKIYSRHDCDVIILRNGVLVATINDSDEFIQITNEPQKRGFFARLFNKGESTTENCEVYYINRVAELENKWGTPNRVDILDKEYDVFTSVGASGSYRFSINNPEILFSKVKGSLEDLSQTQLQEFFRSELNMEIRNYIAEFFLKNNFGIKDLAVVTALEKKAAEEIFEKVSDLMLNYGVKLTRFIINQFNFEEEFVARINDMKKAIVIDNMKQQSDHNKKVYDAKSSAEINTIKFQSEKEQRNENREDFKIVSETIEKINKSEPNVNINVYNSKSEIYCQNCGKINKIDSKYCNNCGSTLKHQNDENIKET